MRKGTDPIETDNDTASKPQEDPLAKPKPQTEPLAEALARHARTRPDHPAIEDEGRVVSYRDLHATVQQLASGMRGAGIKPGDWVAVMLPDNAGHLALLLALAQVGAGILSINPNLPLEDRLQAVAPLAPVALIAASTQAPFAGLPLLVPQTLLEKPSAPRPAPLPISHETPLYCSQSSGTTGTPKTMVWSQGRFAAWFDLYRPHAIWSPDHRYLTQIGLSFEFGRGFALGMIQQGATVIIDRSKSLEKRVATLRDRRITFTLFTPAHLRRFLEHPVDSAPLLPEMKVLFTSASALTVGENRQVRRQLSPNLYQSYATNEVGPIAFARPEDFAAQPEAVGRVMPGIEAQVIDDAGIPQPNGTVGLGRFRNPHYPRGYLDNPEATARHFRDGWFQPGDLAVIDDDGFLYLKGRSDDMIDNQGVKFFPAEVEAVLLSHPAVAEAACFGWPHPQLGQVAVACITQNASVEIDALLQHCLGRLPAHKIPARVFVMTEMPKTPTGKIIKQQLKDLVQAKMASGAAGRQSHGS